MKYSALLFTFTLFSLFGYTQPKETIHFLKNSNREVKTKDSADYIRVITEPESGKTNFKFTEYYKDNTLKRTGKASSFSPHVVLDGEIISYYKNGNVKSRENFAKVMTSFRQVDSAFYYFENGNLKESQLYIPEKDNSNATTNYQIKTLQIGDEQGKLYLDQYGNGKINRKVSTNSTEEGDLKNGFKHGVWKEYNSKTKITYEEEFSEGKFIKGKSITESGEIREYKSNAEVLPEFKGGIGAFYMFITKHLEYPEQERVLRRQGTVTVNFVVEKDGTLTNFKVLRSVTPALDKEALRIVSLSPKWKPGTKRGEPVRVSYSVPIMFKLD